MRIPGLLAQGGGNNLPVRSVPKMTGALVRMRMGDKVLRLSNELSQYYCFWLSKHYQLVEF